jgi:hypothetical protein
MDFEKENINNSTTLSSSSSSSSENENKNDLAVVFSVTLHLDTISMPKLFETHVESRSVGIPQRVMVWNAAHGVISRVSQRRSANEEDMEILRCIIHISRAYCNVHTGDKTFWDWQSLIYDLETFRNFAIDSSNFSRVPRLRTWCSSAKREIVTSNHSRIRS